MRLHLHRWTPVDQAQTIDVSFGQPGIPRTDVLYRCDVCGSHKTKSLDGHWALVPPARDQQTATKETK